MTRSIVRNGVVVFLSIFAASCAAQRATCLGLSIEAAEARVANYIGPHLKDSTNLILEFDHGPEPDDPRYYYWFGMKEIDPPDGSHLIAWYAVDPCTGKMFDGVTYREIRE